MRRRAIRAVGLTALCLLSACRSTDRKVVTDEPGVDEVAGYGADESRGFDSWIDPDADRYLKAMGKTLSELKRFRFRVNETAMGTSSARLIASDRTVTVRRPDRVFTTAGSSPESRRAWYNGKTFSLLDPVRGVHASIPVPPTIDLAVDFLAEEFGLVLPLSDVLFADPYEVLSAGVTRGDYVGLHSVQGRPCHHLAFQQEFIDWQVWIDAGELALPRRFVITYIDEPGAPEYAGTLTEWDVTPDFTEALCSSSSHPRAAGRSRWKSSSSGGALGNETQPPGFCRRSSGRLACCAGGRFSSRAESVLA